MSQKPKNPLRYYLSCGVIKFDYKAAGYPDVMKIAREWAQDENFHELIVRKVSEENFGIQFVYAAENSKTYVVEDLRKELVKRFGKGIYAWDIEESTKDSFEDGFDSILVLRPLTIQPAEGSGAPVQENV